MIETEKNVLSESELIERIENAAREGAKAGAGKQRSSGMKGVLTGLTVNILTPILIVMLALTAFQLLNPLGHLDNLFATDALVEGHDLTLENQGIFGYTVADFSEAVLGRAEQMAKLEVYSREISDIATLTDTGLGKLKVFTKCQLITYHGTATYVVDLSKINESDIQLDEDNLVVTISIPHAELNPINIPSEEIEFGDVTKGLLAVGDIKATPEDMAKVETEAKSKMLEKLESDRTIEDADRFARLTVLELYQPVIKSVAEKYSVEVVFAD